MRKSFKDIAHIKGAPSLSLENIQNDRPMAYGLSSMISLSPSDTMQSHQNALGNFTITPSNIFLGNNRTPKGLKSPLLSKGKLACGIFVPKASPSSGAKYEGAGMY